MDRVRSSAMRTSGEKGRQYSGSRVAGAIESSAEVPDF